MRIHIIATGGAIMHSLAIALHLQGHEVSGSDDVIFDPARSRLQQHGLLPSQEGWNPNRITPDLDLVIIGMHARQDNPELQAAMDLRISVQSFPEYIAEAAKYKTRLVVAGSHGKTTTTSMVAHIFQAIGQDFDVLVGASIEGLSNPVILSDAPVMVIEGDEYLTSALDRRPKVLHYKPQASVITGIAWDHANVFPTEEIYQQQFVDFLQSLDAGSTVFYYSKDAALQQLIDAHGADLNCIPYSEDALPVADNQLQVFGDHNRANLQAARLLATYYGCDDMQVLSALKTFKGAQGRLTKLDTKEIAYRDFAHAPSKVKATTEAVKQQYKDKRLVAVLELHTFSSLNMDFIPQYADTLEAADHVIIYIDPETVKRKKLPELDYETVKSIFAHPNIVIETDLESLESAITKAHQAADVSLFMSSGHFAGLNIQAIVESWS